MHRFFILISFILSASTLSFGQERDYRGQLVPTGRVKELSVSPDGKLWIGTALGALYYADSFESEWKILNSAEIFGLSNNDESDNVPNIDRISFFNSKQAILSGYISLEKWGAKNTIYQTNDGGKTWSPVNFGGDMWVYDAFTDTLGNAWIGGSSGKLHFSDNYGLSWIECPTPDNKSIRIKSVFMSDSVHGILGTSGHYGTSKENYIYITSNNWNTSSKIKTPAAQQKTDRYSEWLDIEEVYIWRGYYIVKQGKDYFYSNMTDIIWEKIKYPLVQITIDNVSQRIFGLTDSFKIIELIDFEKCVDINTDLVKRKPKTFRSVNNCIYILDEEDELYRINQSQATSTLLYSNEAPIEPPAMQDSTDNSLAGVDWKQILLFDKIQNKWYRKGTVDFYIQAFYLLDKTHAILWSGDHSYIFDLSDNHVEIFNYERPISGFLLSGINEVTINGVHACGYGGCHGLRYNLITYKKTDSLLIADNYTVYSVGELGADRTEENIPYYSTFKESTLKAILHGMNENPAYIPAFKEFEITNEDKEFDEELVKQIHSKSEKIEFEKTIQNLDRYLDYKIDTVVNQNGSVVWSTCYDWFSVYIINENGDTLSFTRKYFTDSKACHFPWIVNYGKVFLSSYSLDFARMIDAILPENFRGKEYFDNKVLLIELNDYLNKKKL